MKFLTSIFTLFFLLNFNLFSQDFEWVDVYDTGSECYPRAVEVDNDGNVVTIGYFFGTVDFDPSDGVINKTSTASSDFFVLKTNSLGELLWVTAIGGSGIDEARAVTIDSGGNIYVTGYRYSVGTTTLDFDSGPGTANVTFSGGWNMFVFKLDPDGEVLWAETIDNNTDKHYARSITLDSEENVYIAGRYNGLVDFDPGVGVNEMSSGDDSYDAYVLKLNPDGEFIWSTTTAGIGYSSLWGLGVHADGNGYIYTTGSFEDSTDFDPGDTEFFLDVHESEFSEYEIFIQKLDTAGNFVWAKAVGGAGSEQGFNIDVNDAGDVYIAGSLRDSVDFDPDPDLEVLRPSVTGDDLFLLKLNSDGDYLWVNTYAAQAYFVSPKVNLVGDNLVYLCGIFHGDVDFSGTLDGTDNITATGNADGFIAKYNASGTFMSVNNIGSVSADYIYDFYVSNSNLYLTGFFSSTVDFDFTDGVENRTPIYYSGYTAKYLICPPTLDTVVTTVSTCDSYFWDANGETYYTTGFYTADIPVPGDDCDSTIALDLTINNSPNDYDTVVVCGSYTWAESGLTYISSILDSVTYTNIHGCDSVFFLALTINPIVSNFITESACLSYTVPSGDETYTESGMYTDTLETFLGCDSILYIDLTIHTPVETDASISVCNSYTVPSGDETYTESGIYMDTLTTIYDCDSIITINVTIHTDIETDQTIEICDSYTVPSGDETYTESGIYTDTLLTMFGCDSIITIDLTIQTIDNTITRDMLTLTSLTDDATYQWLNCEEDYAEIDGEISQSFTATENGNYAIYIIKGTCMDTTDCFTINDVSIPINKLVDLITLYPNPTTGSFSIDLGEKHKEIQLELTNLFGQVILSEKYQNTKLIQLNIDGAKGIYFIKIIVDEDNTTTLKIIKH